MIKKDSIVGIIACLLSTCFQSVLSECDPICGCGYQFTTLDVDGIGKQFTAPGEGIENCAQECFKRDGCTSFEYNHVGNQGYKCGTYTGSQSNMGEVRTGRHLDWQTCVTTKPKCNSKCGCGYKYVPYNLNGVGKEWSNPGQGIDKCAKVCDEREGCTGFEYNYFGDVGYGCGTYTGGSENIMGERETSTTWMSCVAVHKEPKGEACGDNECGDGEYCCDPFCGTCAPEGSGCVLGCADKQPEPKMDECSIEVLSVGNDGIFTFDKSALDKVLRRENWDGETLRIDAGHLTVIKEVTVFRNSNGGSIGDAHGRSSWTRDWWVGDTITFVDCLSNEETKAKIGDYCGNGPGMGLPQTLVHECEEGLKCLPPPGQQPGIFMPYVCWSDSL